MSVVSLLVAVAPARQLAQHASTTVVATTTTTPEQLAAAKQAACPEGSTWFCGQTFDLTKNEALAKAVDWVISTPLAILAILAVAFVVNRIARYAIKRSMNRLLVPSEQTQRATRALRRAAPSMLLKTGAVNVRLAARVNTLTTVFRSLASVGIWLTAAGACLGVLHVNLTSLVAISTVAGAAIGFGAQNVVRDFLAGTFFVIEDQFGVGDTVDLGDDVKGTVEGLTLRVTRVRDVNGNLWHVPNGQIKRVANKSQEWARAVLDLEVDGSTDYNQAAAVMQEVAEKMSADEHWLTEVVDTPQVWGIESFTETGYLIRLVVKTRPGTQFGVMRELRIRLLDAFAAHGILLPGRHWATEHADKLAPALESGSATAPAPAPAAAPAGEAEAPAVLDVDAVADNGTEPAARPAPRGRRPATGNGRGPARATAAGTEPAVATPAEGAGETGGPPRADAEQPGESRPARSRPHPARGDPGEAG